MKRLTVVALPLLLASPAIAADYDRPSYSEREYYERRVDRQEPPRIVEREVSPPKIVEHHHYHHKVAPRVYTEERIYKVPRAYAYYDKPHHHYDSWRPRHRFWQRPWRPHHHHGHHHHW